MRTDVLEALGLTRARLLLCLLRADHARGRYGRNVPRALDGVGQLVSVRNARGHLRYGH
jgi:hypothetical protein